MPRRDSYKLKRNLLATGSIFVPSQVNMAARQKAREQLLLEWNGVVVSLGHSFQLHRLKRNDQQLKLYANTPAYPLPGQVSGYEVALDTALGVRLPFFTVNSHDDGMYSVHKLLVYHHSSEQLQVYGQFKTSATTKHRDNSEGLTVLVLDGPTIVWAEGENLHIAMCSDRSCTAAPMQTMKQHKVRVRLCNETEEKSGGGELSVDKMWGFSWWGSGVDTCAGNEITLLLFLSVTYKKSNKLLTREPEGSAQNKWLTLLLTINYELGGAHVDYLHPDMFVPSDYGLIATCVSIHSDKMTVNSAGNLLLRKIFVVGTSYEQVAVFREGCLMSCVPVGGTPIKIAPMQSTSAQFVFTVLTNSRASVYQVRDEESQEVDSWDGASGALVGDFVGSGSEQIFVTFPPQPGEEALSRFCLTDLQHVNMDTRIPSRPRDTTLAAPESLVKALEALRVRKQNGEAYLIGLEQELQQKRQLLKQTLALVESIGPAEVPALSCHQSDQTLACLLPGRLPVGRGAGVDKLKLKTAVRVVQKWHRISGGKWAVGAVIKNKSDSTLDGIGLTIVPGDTREMVDCTSRVVWIEGMETKLLSEAKRPKLEHPCVTHPIEGLSISLGPERSACVVASIPLTGGIKAAALVCSWRPQCPGGVGRMTVQLGNVSLTVKDAVGGTCECSKDWIRLWSGKKMMPSHGIDFSKMEYQDLAIQLGLKSFCQVRAKSTYTSLLEVPALLITRLPLPAQAVRGTKEASETPCTFPHTETSIFNGLNLHVEASSRSAVIGILYMHPSQLSLLIQRMESVFPDDICLETVKDPPRSDVLAECIRSIHKEITLRTQSIRDTLMERSEVSAVTATQTTALEDLSAQTDMAVTMYFNA